MAQKKTVKDFATHQLIAIYDALGTGAAYAEDTGRDSVWETFYSMSLEVESELRERKAPGFS